MKNLESTIEEICKIIPLTESQKNDVRIQIYDLIVHLNRPIDISDKMTIEEITGDDGVSFEVNSDNPFYRKIIEGGKE